jgi:hypothetical protein
MLPVAQRIPGDVLAVGGGDVDEDDQGGSPPVALAIAVSARSPAPTIVVLNPSSIVIGSPSPGLVADPDPAVRRTPAPVTVAIRSPVVIVVDGVRMWTPHPAAVLIRIDPIAVSIQLLSAPDVRVVVTITLLVA